MGPERTVDRSGPTPTAESDALKMPEFLCPRCQQVKDTRPFVGPCAICRLELEQAQVELERVRLIDGQEAP